MQKLSHDMCMAALALSSTTAGLCFRKGHLCNEHDLGHAGHLSASCLEAAIGDIYYTVQCTQEPASLGLFAMGLLHSSHDHATKHSEDDMQQSARLEYCAHDSQATACGGLLEQHGCKCPRRRQHAQVLERCMRVVVPQARTHQRLAHRGRGLSKRHYRFKVTAQSLALQRMV